MPPGADFPAELVRGIRQLSKGQAPEILARSFIVVNTQRMKRRITSLFAKGPATFLPKVITLADLSLMPGAPIGQKPANTIARRIELARLIERLIGAEPDLASLDSVFDLADSLASLIDEMHGEGVSVETIQQLDVSDQSGHWARAQQFIGIAETYVASADMPPDPEAAQRNLVTQMIANWQENPPQTPIILAGSTGSRGTMALLMQAVAKLPQGAVVLPGYDFDAPSDTWAQLGDPLTGEDHPQFRFSRLIKLLGLKPASVLPWLDQSAPYPDRAKVVSLALRPAPFTDAWLDEGPSLGDLPSAVNGLSLIEAETAREEALSIAVRMRQAAEDGQTAALITPDRMLTRQVSAALDRWDIVPDDSAGLPLHLSPPGRLIRQIAELYLTPVRSDALIALLKHPLTHSGVDRGEHLRMTRELELVLRKKGPPFPTIDWVSSIPEFSGTNWTKWLQHWFLNTLEDSEKPLSNWVEELCQSAEAIAGGVDAPDSGGLWQQAAGRSLRGILDELAVADRLEQGMPAQDFIAILDHTLKRELVRDRDAPDENIMIWGTLEARVQGADLVILSGLNEGSWPEAPAPDPWLNRMLRVRAGLLLPDRRIGLSAHDWQQAINAPEVLLTRSKRSDEAETVPSRWLNRLTNLLAGLPIARGDAALDEMRARGQIWLRHARSIDDSPRAPQATRPAPQPPQAARPTQLSVTEIKRLIRDPYAIYARHVLRLRPLDPLIKEPDALVRGTVFHEVMEQFIGHSAEISKDAFLRFVHDVIEAQVAWPVARSLWMARLSQVADWFVDVEAKRRTRSTPAELEVRLRAKSELPVFTLTGVADRIDHAADGTYQIVDYKTGAPPSAKEQAHFDKQLLLEAAVIERQGAGDLPPGQVSEAVFIGLGRKPSIVPAPLSDNPPDTVWADLMKLIAAYASEDQGYTSRRAMQKESEAGDYDQLARFGEWDNAAQPDGVRLR